VTPPASPQPPIARRRPHATTLHGHTLADDYAWLRDKSPDTLAHLAAENAYTAAVTAPQQPLADSLYREMLSHIQETDVSVSYRMGAHFYYTRTVEGLQYPIHCRRSTPLLLDGTSTPDPDAPDDPTLPEQIILDVNQLAAGEAYMSLGALAVSPDGTLLAYTTDNTGFRQYTLHIRNLGNPSAPDQLKLAERVGSIAWAADSRTLFYTVEDEATKRQHQLLRFDVTASAPHTLVFDEPDERYNIAIGRTRDSEFLLLEIGSHITSEVRLLPAATPLADFRTVAPRREGEEYFVDHRAGHLLIRTNDAGRNFRLVTAPVASPDRPHWRELIPHRAGVPLEDFDLFAHFLAVTETHDGLARLRIFPLPPTPEITLAQEQQINFPEPAYTASAHINRVFHSTRFRYQYQSLVTPASVFEFNVRTAATTLLKQQQVPGGFDRTLYASERLHAPAPDGTLIPVSIVYRKDSFRPGTNPLYQYGYGAYGYALPIGFSPTRLALLDRGLVLAYAHIRGGGDLGDPWHDAGKMLLKRNTFTDFIAVTKHLITQKYADPARIAIEGGSAGGLLMGAVVNLRPDLYRAVVSHVPFVDVMNTMLDASLPLTVPEYEEWGNPNQPAAFEYMLSYSPYDNLRAAPYPAMLVKTSLNDSQVMFWEPAKYVAKLRTLKQNPDRPLLLHINMDAGHGGASGRYDYLKEIAFDYAFMLHELNATTRSA
jgi:oligopeptidase B